MKVAKARAIRKSAPKGMFGTAQATAAAQLLIRLRKHYTNPPKTERGLDPIFFGLLTALHPKVKVTRQSHVTFHGAAKPSRIDFRLGGTNPTYLEFAVRPLEGQQELCGPKNHDEHMKLSKIAPSKGKGRILLLVDLKKNPMNRDALKASYDPLHAGRGKKERHPVTVVYVHATTHFFFTWKPRKSAVSQRVA